MATAITEHALRDAAGRVRPAPGGWAGTLTMISGAALQAPLPPRYTDLSPAAMEAALHAARHALGQRLVILGHHYQRSEVIRWADYRGDSFKLCKDAAARPEADYIIFCGVHFMAEAADILSAPHQQVILPDLHAGCSMADMADIDQVEEAWETLAEWSSGRVVPITYMNSSAALKAFVGRHGGAVCTSSNARQIMAWALRPEAEGGAGGQQLLFFPDQHLGRNTALLEMGFSQKECVVWDPAADQGGLSREVIRTAPILLWKGHCSVHGTFLPIHIRNVREQYPGVQVIVHPECVHEVVVAADAYGSTEKIKKLVEAAPPGATLAIGTEINLVSRLAEENPDKTVLSLNPNVCVCSTMYRIDPPHLLWVMENLLADRVVNRIVVPEPEASEARLALQRMLDHA